jgi:hypothetical protein
VLTNYMEHGFSTESDCLSAGEQPFRLYVVLKAKIKLSRYALQARRGRKCSSYSFFTSELDGSECSALRPGRALPPGKKSRYQLHRRLDGFFQL